MLVGFKAKNHPQQKAKPCVDDRMLPDAEFWVLNKRFSFTVDAAAARHNARLERYWTEQDSGLNHSWAAERVYCNPPYSKIEPWIEKAWKEDQASLIVMLLPANRTEQKWWQTHVEPMRDRAGSPLRVEFLPNRIRFKKPGQTMIGPNERPPFGCCLLIWDYSSSNPKAVVPGGAGSPPASC
jgi:phage N-6-adenine-methyltransferase